MARFLAGFALASAVWVGVIVAARNDALPIDLLGGGTDGSAEGSPDAGPGDALSAGDEADEDDRRRPRRRRRRRARSPEPGAKAGGEGLGPEVAEGDDLDALDGPRQLDLAAAGGEAQLAASQVDQAMGSAMGRFQRCLVLAAGEAPVRGRLVFDLQVGSDGQVDGVRLRGPAAVASGEAGACLRGAARQVRFPTYDGPPTRARWSLTLE